LIDNLSGQVRSKSRRN